MQSRILIWVTSDCNLDCKLCSQRYTRNTFPGYHMSRKEVDFIVTSLLKREIKFDVIELTGGEPSLWNNLEYGAEQFKKVCKTVTLVTNGNNPERVIALGLSHWLVSTSQATKRQVQRYLGSNVTFINHQHRRPPTSPIEKSLPAKCCVERDCFGNIQTSLLYILGQVVYCCNAYAISEYVKLDPMNSCQFVEDFRYLQVKTYDQEICSYCICNKKVWDKLNG